jgi:hypothetical protein
LAALRAKVAELEKALKAAQDAQAAQLAVNKALQEEFRRYRAQHAQGKLGTHSLTEMKCLRVLILLCAQNW